MGFKGVTKLEPASINHVFVVKASTFQISLKSWPFWVLISLLRDVVWTHFSCQEDGGPLDMKCHHMRSDLFYVVCQVTLSSVPQLPLEDSVPHFTPKVEGPIFPVALKYCSEITI